MQRGWVSLVLHRLWLGSLERTIISVNARFLCLSNTTAKTYSLERETRSMVKDWLDWLKTIQPKHHEWASIVCASHEVMSGSSQPMTRYSRPGSSVHRILQARVLERVAIPFSKGSS